MKSPPSFQLAETDLRPGVTLIEASAGTGKTFTIAGLFLRLLIEQKLSVSEILVVTYTEAATEELRGRIRQTLTSAVNAFLAGNSSDHFLQALVEQHRATTADLLARLGQAVSNFDEAPIFTIHGFCQRQLRDRAFESGTLFDTELITDPSALLQEIADDYWRRHFYEAESLLVQVALKNGLGPDRLLPDLELHGRHPKLKIVSAVDGRTLAELGTEMTSTFTKARALWQAEQPVLRAIFADAVRWGIGEHGKPELVAEQLTDLERCFSESATPESFKSLKFFSTASIQKGTGKRSPVKPAHAFFDLCEQFGQQEKYFLVGLRLDFLKFAETELPRRKQRLKVQAFDDLLTRLHSALTVPGGESLAREIRSKYKAALIDEFQDTDPVQYQIFGRIFAPREAAGSGGPVPLLFLIGDPKQAIYGFRGADFFTYLDAARRANQRFTLDANWRSESGLVTAVNTLFQRAAAPFVFEEIPFHPVIARGKADEAPLREQDGGGAPFELWFYPRGENGKGIPQAQAEEVLPHVVASEIVRLLNGNTRLGDERRLGPQDIAVLVLKHSQATLMQEALRARNIPSVLHTEASLFGSAEARELHRVLAAIVEPANERLLRAAFATSLLGVSLAELDALTRDIKRWPLCLERFHHYANLWTERGFTPMMRALLHEEQLRQRLLAFPDGERRLTNVLHLAEALHQASLERRLGPAGLQQWLADHIASEDKAAEEHQLRLERDDFAVRLVTIHKSKGLEYPVVFCPFAWKSSDLKWAGEEQVFFHEQPEGGDSQFVRDFGSANLEAHRALAFREKLAENVRLLYVALTRARNRCYLVWGNFKNADTSAPAWLFHSANAAGASMDQMEERFNSLDDATMRRDLSALAKSTATQGSGPGIRLRDLPPADDEPYRPALTTVHELSPRPFAGAIEREWRVTSFSALATHQRDERPDYDSIEKPAPMEPAEEGSLFAFPRGTHAGTCLHKIFELLDFTTLEATTIEQLVREQLRAHGFDPEKFASGLVGGVQRALQVPLDPELPELTLSSIADDQRLNELEFSFPVQRATPALLQELFAGTDAGTAQLQFDPVRGYLQGFIDLVFESGGRFYVLDWKSNWLGNQVEDYHQDALRREMNGRHYRLQYHLYALALHRFLALRLPDYDYEEHFGGVFYVFVRGIDPTRPEFGIFRDRPTVALIESLSERLIGSPEGVTA